MAFDCLWIDQLSWWGGCSRGLTSAFHPPRSWIFHCCFARISLNLGSVHEFTDIGPKTVSSMSLSANVKTWPSTARQLYVEVPVDSK